MTSVTVMHVAGAPVRLHWTVLLLGWLVVPLTTQILPDSDGAPTWALLVASFVVIVGIVTGIVLHEASHALAGRRYDMQPYDIVVHGGGGAASFLREAPTPRAEAVVAGVGPATSIAFGLTLSLIHI